MFYTLLEPQFCLEYELQGFLSIQLLFLTEKFDFLQAFGCSRDLDPAGGHPPSENVAFLIISEGVKPNREIGKRLSKSRGVDVNK